MHVDPVATSPQFLRKLNASAVLRYALATDAFSASDVMTATGLTRSTALGLCNDLVDLGWLDEVDDTRAAGLYSKGRPARRYRLRARAGHIVGVDAGQHSITALVTDLDGTELARTVTRIDGNDPSMRVSITRNAIETVSTDIGIGPDDIYVTVIGVPAPVDEHGKSPVSSEFWAQMNPNFVSEFPEYGKTIIENDANLAALAERARGAGRNTTSFAALLSGERMGAGLIVNDTLIRGRYGGAGELRMLEIVEGVGSADGLALLARTWATAARQAGKIRASSPLAALPASAISAADVFTAAADGDQIALGILDQLGDRLARVAEVLVSVLDVERVIVAGAIASAAAPVIAKAMEVLQNEFEPPLPEIVASELGGDGVLLGAVDCGLSLVRSTPLAFGRQPA